MTVVDTQDSLSETLILDLTNSAGPNNGSVANSDRDADDNPLHTTPTCGEDAPSGRAQPSRKPEITLKRRRGSGASHDLAAALMVKCLAQNVLREDYYSFLESELPRWTREGLWAATSSEKLQQQPLAEIGLPSPTRTIANTPSTSPHVQPPSPSCTGLERAYQAVCQLDTRMSDDVLRNRIALVQLHLEYKRIHDGRKQGTSSTRGRGDASRIIDRILESTHRVQWADLDQRQRADLRAKFHNRKRYGKRWAQLADALGTGILLLCATKLANAM